MRRDNRASFIRKWWERALDSDDPFDRFFCLWLTLIVAARAASFRTASLDEDTDRQVISEYFLIPEKQRQVLAALADCAEEMIWLAQRRGTATGCPMLDAGGDLREKLQRLSAHYNRNLPLSADDHVVFLARFLNKVRNNVFHGIKIYDSHSDLELLKRVNPVLEGILERTESLTRTPH